MYRRKEIYFYLKSTLKRKFKVKFWQLLMRWATLVYTIMMLSLVEFEQLVAKALDELPEFIHQKMTNVEVLIEPWPNRRQLFATDLPQGHTLLGLYHGVPLTERSTFYALVPPDTITLFQGPIEQAARSQERVVEVVRRTVVHEVAHHFGISDDRLRELGAY